MAYNDIVDIKDLQYIRNYLGFLFGLRLYR